MQANQQPQLFGQEGSVGAISATPTIASTSFQLTKDDIENVFRMFGELKSVTLNDDEEYALITFQDFISAFFAQQSFNNHYLHKYNAIL